MGGKVLDLPDIRVYHQGKEEGRLEGIKEGIQEGKQEEKENGIKIFIEDKVEDGVPKDKILSKLMKLYVLPEDAAKEYLNKYYKR